MLQNSLAVALEASSCGDASLVSQDHIYVITSKIAFDYYFEKLHRIEQLVM